MDLRKKRMLKVKTKKLANSFKYAGRGIISSLKTEYLLTLLVNYK